MKIYFQGKLSVYQFWKQVYITLEKKQRVYASYLTSFTGKLKTYGGQGWSFRRIGRELRIDEGTFGKRIKPSLKPWT
jgi:hypothetical protein